MRYRWPNEAQCAVVLSFDVDAESGFIYRNPEQARNQIDEIEERRFGVRTGVDRILRLLDKYGLPATFFVPGYTIRNYTDVVKRIQSAGYEMAAHGNVHETLSTLDEEAERRVFREQLAIFQEHLGIRPVGYRSPSWSLNVRTPALLKEHGFVYDSSLMGDDIPYWVDTPHGRLPEVPVQWLLDDAPYFRHVYGLTNQIASPNRVMRMWAQEFRGMYRENGCFVATMHPFIIGRAGRMDALEWLIRSIRREPGVWFATCLEVAEWAIETNQNPDVKARFPDELQGASEYLKA